MSPHHRERLLWGASLLLVIAAVVGWRRGAPVTSVAPPTISGAVALTPSVTAESLRQATRRIGAHDPFRLDRAPAAIAYDPAREGMPPPPPPPPVPPKPALALAGVVGPPWEAMLDGVPGRQGAVVVRPGDTLSNPMGELRIRRITRDTLIVQGMDTTWKLTLRRAW